MTNDTNTVPVIETQPEPELTPVSLQSSLATSATPNPLETSATGFGLYFPVFKNLVTNKLSGNSAKRVLIALFGAKLEGSKTNQLNDVEQTVFKIANKLFDDVLVLTLGTLLQEEAKREQLRNGVAQQTDQEVLNSEVQSQLEVVNESSPVVETGNGSGENVPVVDASSGQLQTRDQHGSNVDVEGSAVAS